MMSGSSAPRTRLRLVAAFGTLHDAEVAARYLADRGVTAETIGVTRPAPKSRSLWKGGHRVSRPLLYAAYGGALTGLAGSIVWNVIAPDFLTIGWSVAAPAIVGASAAGSIGVLVDNGLEPRSQGDSAGARQIDTPTHEGAAVVAVDASSVDCAVELLRGIGVERILIRNDAH